MSNLNSEELVSFKARPYQEELVEKAIDNNTIVYLPTGTGKTYIAVMLARELATETEKKYSDGGKRSIFLAPTVPLAIQQAEYFNRNIASKIECYYGDRKIDEKLIDLWDETIWKQELEDNQLLVMTPRILTDMIKHSFINLEKINLIIFDECHRAVGLHEYSQILNSCREFDPDGNSIRILGLTASLIQKKCNLNEFNTHFKKLEQKFNCKIETAFIDSDDINNNNSTMIFKKPEIKLVVYQDDTQTNIKIAQRLDDVINNLNQVEKKYTKFQEETKDEISQNQNDNFFRYLKREFGELKAILSELGLYNFKISYEMLKKSIDLKLDLYKLDEKDLNVIRELIVSLTQMFDSLINFYLPNVEEEEKIEKILVNSSEKVRCLMNIYKERKENCSDKDFHSIIFVERRKVARSLCELIQKLSELDEYNFLKPSYVVGTNGSEDFMNQVKQKAVLNKFRNHEINILVATNIIEEGLDIPACNMVIRFSKPNNFCSFIQSKGRARSNTSCYILLVDEKNYEESKFELKNFIEIENEIQKKLVKNRDESNENMVEDEVEKINKLIPPLRKESSELTCMKAVDLINR